MSNDDLESKFRDLSQDVLPKAKTDRLIELCWNVESLGNINELTRASVPG